MSLVSVTLLKASVSEKTFTLLLLLWFCSCSPKLSLLPRLLLPFNIKTSSTKLLTISRKAICCTFSRGNLSSSDIFCTDELPLAYFHTWDSLYSKRIFGLSWVLAKMLEVGSGSLADS